MTIKFQHKKKDQLAVDKTEFFLKLTIFMTLYVYIHIDTGADTIPSL